MQVAASVAAVAAVYMKLFLPDSVIKDGVLDRAILEQKPCVIHLDGESAQDSPVFKSMPSLDDMLSLLQTRSWSIKSSSFGVLWISLVAYMPMPWFSTATNCGKFILQLHVYKSRNCRLLQQSWGCWPSYFVNGINFLALYIDIEEITLKRMKKIIQLSCYTTFFDGQYYLKARFHFNKHQFADLMMISGIAGTISQVLFISPTLYSLNFFDICIWKWK